MSNIWSTKIQGVNTLNMTREVTFSNGTFENIVKIIGIKDKTSILEVGCGPGTFTRLLAKTFRKSIVTGIDLDENFIDFNIKKASEKDLTNIKFDFGDALSLPYNSNTFDLCTSHTVIEHIPNKEFLQEQYRVCKPGGKVAALNVRAELSLKSDNNIEPSDREKELLKKIGEQLDDSSEKYNVGNYFSNPQDILKIYEDIGFEEIKLDVMTYVTCIDDVRNSMNQKIRIVESERQSQFEFIKLAKLNDNDVLGKDEERELIHLINRRYNSRIKNIESGKNMWDFNIRPMIIITGIKPMKVDK